MAKRSRARFGQAVSEASGRGAGTLLAALPISQALIQKASEMLLAAGINPDNVGKAMSTLAIFASVLPQGEKAGELLEGFIDRMGDELRLKRTEIPTDPAAQADWLTKLMEGHRKSLTGGESGKGMVTWQKAVAALPADKRADHLEDLAANPVLYERFKKEGHHAKLDVDVFSKVILELPTEVMRNEMLALELDRSLATPAGPKLPKFLQEPLDRMKASVKESMERANPQDLTRSLEVRTSQNRELADQWSKIMNGE